MSVIICPHCGRDNDEQTRPSALLQLPKDGDAGICYGCGGLSIFVVTIFGFSQRLPTPEEKEAMDGDYEIQLAVAAWEQRGGDGVFGVIMRARK